MPTRVLKFGGTSVETPTHILAVARRILAARESADAIVVVVSAMGQTTDELLRLAHRVSRTPPRRELDMLLTAGERISMTLLAMCLESLGCPAISFTGSQSGIVTDSRHADARIRSVRCFRLEEELARGRVVIVAGFQGVSLEKEVTTLGRGGSDTTAVALAIRLGAERCEIYTDVPGVLSADPRVVPGARVIRGIGYEPMIALSHLGGRVLFRRAVLLARKYGMPVEVLGTTSFVGTPALEPGTRVARTTGNQRSAARPMETELTASEPKDTEPMETDRILGIALESPVHWVRVLVPAGPSDGHGGAGVPASPESAADAFPAGSPLLLWYNRTLLPGGGVLAEFVAGADTDLEAWLDSSRWGPGASILADRSVAAASVIGEGIVSTGALLHRASACLAAEGIPLLAIHTSSLSLSMLVPEPSGEAATRALHRALVEESNRT